MRLFEVASVGPLLDVLRILQAQADEKGDALSISFNALKKMVNIDDFGISTPDALDAWNNKFDEKDKIIKAIEKDPSGRDMVVINTKNQAATPDANKNVPRAPSVEKMASSGLPDKLKP